MNASLPDASIHAEWWKAAHRLRQREIDASIAAKAEYEYLYDKPYEDQKKVRVAGPFTVESLSPHRVLGVDENDELIDLAEKEATTTARSRLSDQMILENLRRTAGVQQAHKEDRISFTSLVPVARASYICAEGATWKASPSAEPDLHRPRVRHGASRPTSWTLRARRRRRLRRADRLRLQLRGPCHRLRDPRPNPGAQGAHERRPAHGRRPEGDRQGQPLRHLRRARHRDSDGADDGLRSASRSKASTSSIRKTGEVRSEGADGIACWFIDTDYNEESFFVRHAYFLGANDPYKALKTTLKAEIDEEAWATLHSDTSRPFEKPSSGRIAVKVINHLGDEVMKVFGSLPRKSQPPTNAELPRSTGSL
jgi:adenine-specific DNA-methyltransferase